MTAGAAVWGAVPSLLLGSWDLTEHPLLLNVASISALLYVSTFASVLAFVVWSAGVNIIGSATAAPFMNLLPVFTAVLAVLLLHERLGAYQVGGGLVIIAGAIGSSLFRANPRTVLSET